MVNSDEEDKDVDLPAPVPPRPVSPYASKEGHGIPRPGLPSGSHGTLIGSGGLRQRLTALQTPSAVAPKTAPSLEELNLEVMSSEPPTRGSVDELLELDADDLGDDLLDLPAVRVTAPPKVPLAPALDSTADLPAVKFLSGAQSQDALLPKPKLNATFAGLPTPKMNSGNPGAPEAHEVVDLPTRMSAAHNLPQVRLSDQPSPTTKPPLPPVLDFDDFGDPDEEPITQGLLPVEAGLEDFGQLELDGSDGMEFDALPVEDSSSDALQLGADASLDLPEFPLASEPEKKKAKRPKQHKKSTWQRYRGVFIVCGMMFLFLLSGVGLTFTKFGFFGVYVLEKWMPAARGGASVDLAFKQAATTVSTDTYTGFRQALIILGKARHANGLHRQLWMRSLTLEVLYQLRFGKSPEGQAHIAALYHRIEERGFDVSNPMLVRGLEAAAAGKFSEAIPFLSQADAVDPKNAEIALIQGEIALRERRADAALAAFRTAEQRGGRARAQWGVARAVSMAAGLKAAAVAVQATLEASPSHASAWIAKGRLAYESGDHNSALRWAEWAAGATELAGQRLIGSNEERARAWALVGVIHESKQRYKRGELAFERALAEDPNSLDGLLGAGRVLFREGRAQDALSRFDTVSGATLATVSTDMISRSQYLEAELGAIETLLTLTQTQQAKSRATALSTLYPKNAQVAYWFGKIEEVLGNIKAAEGYYRAATEIAPEASESYLALSRLLFVRQGSADQDQTSGQALEAVLETARALVPETAAFRRELGRIEAQRRHWDQAEKEFKRALLLDADDNGALFGLANVYRQAGRLNEAEQTLDLLAVKDKNYPSLSVERGALYEVQGRVSAALESYEAALRLDPKDTDAMLRFGIAQLWANQLDGAEATLKKVMQVLPNSAGGEHYLGRVAYAKKRLPEAMLHFERATALDSMQGDYFLYVARTALDSGNLSRAMEQIQVAISKDPMLGDAYWVRGQIRLRTGQVQDALSDFDQALALNPKRIEAYAGKAECYDQLHRLGDAIRTYQDAISKEGTNGAWWYGLGRLQLDAGNRREAERALSQATTLGDASHDAQDWLAEAHRIYAETLKLAGNKHGALQHFKRYLDLAPANGMDRANVERSIKELH